MIINKNKTLVHFEIQKKKYVVKMGKFWFLVSFKIREVVSSYLELSFNWERERERDQKSKTKVKLKNLKNSPWKIYLRLINLICYFDLVMVTLESHDQGEEDSVYS